MPKREKENIYHDQPVESSSADGFKRAFGKENEETIISAAKRKFDDTRTRRVRPFNLLEQMVIFVGHLINLVLFGHFTRMG